MSADRIGAPTRITHGHVADWQFLLKQGGYWTAKEIAQAHEQLTFGNRQARLERLFAGGHVMRKGAGVNGDPYRYGVTARCTEPVINAQTDTGMKPTSRDSQVLESYGYVTHGG